jgi:hypothetical protein
MTSSTPTLAVREMKKFGKDLRKDFLFDENWSNLNHGKFYLIALLLFSFGQGLYFNFTNSNSALSTHISLSDRIVQAMKWIKDVLEKTGSPPIL